MALMLRPLRVCDRQKRKRLRYRCFATATDINTCSVARSIEVTMVGRYRSIDRDYQGQLSRRLRSRVLMHAYATRGLGFLVCSAIISRQLGQGRQLSGGSPLFMINHRSSYILSSAVHQSLHALSLRHSFHYIGRTCSAMVRGWYNRVPVSVPERRGRPRAT